MSRLLLVNTSQYRYEHSDILPEVMWWSTQMVAVFIHCSCVSYEWLMASAAMRYFSFLLDLSSWPEGIFFLSWSAWWHPWVCTYSSRAIKLAISSRIL